MKSIKKLLSKKHKNKHNYILTKKNYKSRFNKSNYNLNGGFNFNLQELKNKLVTLSGKITVEKAKVVLQKGLTIVSNMKNTAVKISKLTPEDIAYLIIYKIKNELLNIINPLFKDNQVVLDIIEHIIDNNLSTIIRTAINIIPNTISGAAKNHSNANVNALTDINITINEIIATLDYLNIIINNEIPNITITINSESSKTNASSNAVSHVNTLYSIVYNTLKKSYNDFFQYLVNNNKNKLNIFYYLIYSIIIQSKLIGIKSPELINIIIYILDIFKQIKVNINSNNSNGKPVNIIDVVRESIIKKKYIDAEDIDDIFLIINIIIENYKEIFNITTTHHSKSSRPLNLVLLLCYTIQDIYINIKDILYKLVTRKFIRVTEINAYIKNINIDIDIEKLLSLKLYILIDSINNTPNYIKYVTLSNLNATINIKDIIKTIILIFFTDNTINYDELLNIDRLLFTDNTINYDELINNITIYDLLKVINAFLNKYNNFIYCIFSIIENILTKQLKDIFKIKINRDIIKIQQQYNNSEGRINTIFYNKFQEFIKTLSNQLNLTNSDNPDAQIYDKLNIEIIITELINIIKSNISHITVNYYTGHVKNNESIREFVIKGLFNSSKPDVLRINTNQYSAYFASSYTEPYSLQLQSPSKPQYVEVSVGGGGSFKNIKSKIIKAVSRLKRGINKLSLFNKSIVIKCEFDYLLNNKLTDNSYLLNILLGTNSQVALFLKNIKCDVKIPDNFKLIIIIILNLLKINDDTINKIISKLESINIALTELKRNMTELSKYENINKDQFNAHINTFIESIMKIYNITYMSDTEKQVFTVDNSDIKKYRFNKLKTLIITRLLNKLQKDIINLSLKTKQIKLYIKLIIDIIEYITPIIINIKQIETGKIGDLFSLLIGNIFSANTSNISATGKESEISKHDISILGNSTHDISTHDISIQDNSIPDNINKKDKLQCENLVHINKSTLIGKLYKRLPIIIKKYDIISSLLLFPYNLYKLFKLYEPYNKIYTIFGIAIDANGNPIDDTKLSNDQKKHNKQIIEIYKNIIDTVYNYYYYVFSYIIYNTNTVTNENITTKSKSYDIIINLNHNATPYKLKINFKNIKLVNNTFSSDTSSGISSSDITVTIDKTDQSIIDIVKLTKLLKTIFKLNLNHEAIKNKKIELLKLTPENIKNTDEENIEFLKKILFEYSYGIYSDYFDNHSIDKANNNNKHKINSCINDLTYYTPCTIPTSS